MSYFRSITYIDYFENGFKCSNMGHTKWEVKDQECKITIHIRGLKNLVSPIVNVNLLLGDHSKGYKFRKLAVLDITDGSVSKSMLFSVNSIAGVAFAEISGLHFALSDRCYGVTLLNGNSGELLMMPMDSPSDRGEEPVLAAAECALMPTIKLVKQQSEQLAPTPCNTMTVDMRLAEDKWGQLLTMYPVVHPLRNEREYISISPKDFVIFPNEYQKLVHNSFLLHGFYNYQHIILGKYEDDYYLGVPGTYHDREALVASMFGFEGFESVDKKETGSFGYYMTKVSI